ncbi:MAG TPA: phosphoglycerate mutase family protein [Terriglobales bacterium]|jgi:phosphohistidine phosphatase
MIIYFIRHANAGDTKKDLKKDDQRGLTPEGLEQCYHIARMFTKLDVVPDVILSSSLKRAMQTAAMIANELAYDDRLRIEKSLRPDGTWESFRSMIKSYNAETLLVVGHNPNLEQFVGHIISESGHRAEIQLRKAGVARVEYDGRRGELDWLLTPRMIRELDSAAQQSAAAASKVTLPATPPKLLQVHKAIKIEKLLPAKNVKKAKKKGSKAGAKRKRKKS